jgi:glycosyltransferase involved in cell wall biosynthesis
MLSTKLREASFIAAISEYNREYLADKVGGWVIEKTHIIHCGIIPNDYVPRRSALEMQESGSSIRRERLEIIHIGSLQPYKGQRFLVEACALLRQNNIPFHCRIIGGGEERQILEKQIAELGLQNEIELLGPQPQESIAHFLPTADCYVQPSIVTPSGKMEVFLYL